MRALRLQGNYKQRHHKKFRIPRRESHAIRPIQNKKLSKRKRILGVDRGKHAILDYDINIRAILAAFSSGNGPDGIGRNNAFMGVSGCKSWERTSSNHSPKVMKLIMFVVQNVIDDALKGKIEAAIRVKLADLSEEDN